jgi:hypothetical protein
MEYSKRKGFIALLCLVAFIKPAFASSPIVNPLPEGLVMLESNTMVAPFIALIAPQPRVSASMVAKPVNEDIMGLIRRYDWDWKTAYAIAKCESSFKPTAYNPERHRGCNGSYGIFQVACLHWKEGEDRFDPALNVGRAYEVYKRQGWRAWRNCYKAIQ